MKRDAMLALAAAILVVLATPQLTEAKCMTTPAVEKFFTDAVRGNSFPSCPADRFSLVRIVKFRYPLLPWGKTHPAKGGLVSPFLRICTPSP